MNSININTEGYSAPNGADDLEKNWAAAFAKHEVNNHKTAPVLDHPDGSVTVEKLSDEVKARISEAYDTAQTATETAITAKATADSAKTVADIAKTIADDAFNYSYEARGMANDADAGACTANETANAAEQRAISAETKADAAVTSASGAVQKAEDVQSDLEEHSNNTDIHTTAEEKAAVDERIHTAQETADVALSTANLAGSDAMAAQSASEYAVYLATDAQEKLETKSDKLTITTTTDTALSYEFSANTNAEIRTGELTSISFTFGDGEYEQDYTSGLSFDSGETPTAIDYTDSGILNWVGTDCATSDGLSIFQPSANTHYDIVFYFNGTQFIGLVNGFVPATGNEAV